MRWIICAMILITLKGQSTQNSTAIHLNALQDKKPVNVLKKHQQEAVWVDPPFREPPSAGSSAHTSNLRTVLWPTGARVAGCASLQWHRVFLFRFFSLSLVAVVGDLLIALFS